MPDSARRPSAGGRQPLPCSLNHPWGRDLAVSTLLKLLVTRGAKMDSKSGDTQLGPCAVPKGSSVIKQLNRRRNNRILYTVVTKAQ